MTTQRTILQRIRQALAPPADAAVRDRTAPLPTDRVAAARAALPAVPADYDGRCALFAERAADLRATFARFPTRDALIGHVAKLAQDEGWQQIATHDNELNLAACNATTAECTLIARGYDREALAACDAGITRCDALIAQTGSVLVTSTTSGGRALSVLPPHHVVLATRDQLVPDIVAGYERTQQTHGPAWPSMVSLITGPSRTGDIERTLVLGAHGPQRLTILLLEEDGA